MTDTRELAQPSTSHCRRQRLIVTPANSLPLEVRNHEPELSLEESFATGKYGGSFKLRFQRNTKRTAAADMSDATTDDDCEVECKEEAYLPAYTQNVQAVTANAVSSHFAVEVPNMTDMRELSQPSTSHRHQRLIVTPANSLSNLPLEVHNHEPELPLEESFATGKYGGSFKLLFQRNTKQTAAADMSDVTTDDDDCEVESEEESTKVDEDEASAAVTIVTTILDVQQSHHDDNTTDPLSAMEENQGVEPAYTQNVQAVTANAVSSHFAVEVPNMTGRGNLSQPSTSHRHQRLIVTPANSLSNLPLEVHNHEPELPLEESFATGKYGGSFKLLFQRNTKQTAAADMSDVTTDDDDCEVEFEEESTKVDEDEASAAVTIVTTILDVQQSHHDDNTTDPLSAMEENQGVEPAYTQNVQAVTVNAVSSHFAAEALRSADEETIGIASDFGSERDESFQFFPPEMEPKLKNSLRQRAQKAVRAAAVEVEDKKKEVEICCTKKCASIMSCLLWQPKACKHPHVPTAPEFTPQLQHASKQGFAMMMRIIFPALPKFMRDLWVAVELFVTLFAFILGLLELSLEENKAFNIVYLVLTIVSVVLALIDSFIYFVQLGSCAEFLNVFRSKLGSKVYATNHNDTSNEEQTRKCWHLSPKWKERFEMWFELIRNILSELLLYPLLVCDLFDFITGGSYGGGSSQDKVNFTLFVVGSFYLILSVYFMRVFMVFSSLISLRRIPNSASNSGEQQAALVTKFCIHILGQIVVHIMVVVAIAAKIHHENPEPNQDLYVSPFLVVVIVLGGIIPLAGVMAFFLVNYYSIQAFSVGFWIDMVSLLQAESFADTVFQGKGLQVAKEKAKMFVEKSEFREVKNQFEVYNSTPYWVKFLYPLKISFFFTLGILYDIAIACFIISLAFSTNSATGETEIAIFEDHTLNAAFFITAMALLITNAHILILVNLFLLAVLAVALIVAVMVAIVTPFVILVYIPVGACTGYLYFFRSVAKAMDLHIKPS